MMLSGICVEAATVTLIAFYAMTFTCIHYDKAPRQAYGSGHSWGFTFFIFAITALLLLQSIYLSQYKFQTTQTWGMFIQLVGFVIVLTNISVQSRQNYVEWINFQLEHYVSNTYLKLHH